MRKFIILLFLAGTICYGQELALVKIDGKFGYIDTTGVYAVQPNYVSAKNFSDGLAAFKTSKRGKWGFINNKGEIVIEPTYDKVRYFKHGICLVLQQKKWHYIDQKGASLPVPDTDKFFDYQDDGVAFIRKNSQIGIIDTNGNVICKPKYQLIKKFVNGYARAKYNDKWGVIDLKGEIVIPFEYTHVGNYENGLTIGRQGDVFGLIIKGVFKPVNGATKMYDFNGEQYAPVRVEEKFGFIDRTGKWIIEPRFKKARPFRNGLAPVLEHNLWGYIHAGGTYVIEPKFSDALYFTKEGLAPVKSEMWGFINKEGKMVIPTDYRIAGGGLIGLFKNEGRGFINGIARIGKNKKWAFIDINGNVLGDKWFDKIEVFKN